MISGMQYGYFSKNLQKGPNLYQEFKTDVKYH